MKRIRRSLKDNFYSATAIFFRRVMLLLPRRAALGFGAWMVFTFFGVYGREKRKVEEHLKLALGIEDPAILSNLSRSCFRNIGKSVVEVMRFARLDRAALDRFVRIEGRDVLDEAWKKGRGVILVTAHFGNWELLGAALALHGYPLYVITREVRSRTLEELMRKQREMVGLKVIHRGASVKTGLKCLKRNEMLGILGDVDTKADSVFVEFFGQMTFTPSGPVAIALKTRSPVIPTFIVRQPDDTHVIVIEKPLELKETGQRELDIQVNTQNLTRVIESYIRRFPSQWIWMHRRWKTRPPKV